MKTTIVVRNPSEVRAAFSALRDSGFDVYRGQNYPWPVRSSLFRLNEDDRAKATRRLDTFLEWCTHHPRLARYLSRPEQLIGIAQHYGIPTPFLDLTYSPEVALFFAINTSTGVAPRQPVVNAWRLDSIRAINGVEVVTVAIDNLWRLAAQHGLFVQLPPGEQLDSIECQEIRIEATEPGAWTGITYDEVFPQRKSILETILDNYFYREEMVETLSAFSHARQIRRRWQSLPGAFIKRQFATSNDTIERIDQVWFRHQVQPRIPPESEHCVTCTVSDLSQDSNADASAVLKAYETSKSYPAFKVSGMRNERENEVVSRLLNHVFDGIVAYPFSFRGRTACLANCFRLLPALRRPDATDAVFVSMQALFGPLESVEFASFNGFHTGGAASRERLVACLDPSAISQLQPFYRRLVEANPLQMLCLSLDPLHSLRFDRFSELFVEQIVPSQALANVSQQLADLRDGTVADDATPSLVFDPLNLAYFGVTQYQFISPVVHEADVGRIVILEQGMSADDVRDQILAAWCAFQSAGTPFLLRLHGFGRDRRPLREIPEACELAQHFVKLGGISLLEVSSTTQRPSGDPLDVAFPAMGAFESWLLARGELSSMSEEKFQARVETFWHELGESNTRLDALGEASGER